MVACGQLSLGLPCWLRLHDLVNSIQRPDQLEHHIANRLIRYAMRIAHVEG